MNDLVILSFVTLMPVLLKELPRSAEKSMKLSDRLAGRPYQKLKYFNILKIFYLEYNLIVLFFRFLKYQCGDGVLDWTKLNDPDSLAIYCNFLFSVIGASAASVLNCLRAIKVALMFAQRKKGKCFYIKRIYPS